MIDEAKDILLALAKASMEFERFAAKPGSGPALKKAGELLGDDPAYAEYQGFFEAMRRGAAASQKGMSPGEAFDKEIERHKKDSSS